MIDLDALLERLDYLGGYRNDPPTNSWQEAAAAIRELREQLDKPMGYAHVPMEKYKQLKAAEAELKALKNRKRYTPVLGTAYAVNIGTVHDVAVMALAEDGEWVRYDEARQP